MSGTNSLILPAARATSFAHRGNQLREALPLAKLNRTQRNICSFLWRRTYGCNRTRNVISLSEFQAACLCCKEYIARQIKILMKKRIIKRIFIPGRASIFHLNYDVTDWEEGSIDLAALAHGHESPGTCTAEEMTGLSSAPEPLSTDDSEAEVVEHQGSSADKDEMTHYPFLTGGWQTDYIPLNPKRTNRRLGQELSGSSTPELSERSTPELFGRSTPELSGRSTPKLSGRLTPELFERSTPELSGRLTPELFERSTPELYKRTTPAHASSRTGSGFAPPLNTVLNTILKTVLKT